MDNSNQMPSESTTSIIIEWKGHDFIEVQSSTLSQRVQQIKIVGCAKVHNSINEYYKKYEQLPVKEWPLPEGTHHADMLLRELILKASGKWQLPYTEDELCHCRGVLTQKVDESILNGADTPQQVSIKTGAGSACGTCQIHTEAIIKYRHSGT